MCVKRLRTHSPASLQVPRQKKNFHKVPFWTGLCKIQVITVTAMGDVFGDEDEVPAEHMGTYRLSTLSVLLASAPPGSPERDIAQLGASGPSSDDAVLESIEHAMLVKMLAGLGSKHVTRRKEVFSPQCVLQKAIKKEQDTWENCFTCVRDCSVSFCANVIGSHFVYKVENE